MTLVNDVETAEFDSSNLHSGLYRARDEVLYLRFNSGDRIYRYAGVPLDIWKALLRADSKGGFFHKHIRDQFPTREITNPRD